MKRALNVFVLLLLWVALPITAGDEANPPKEADPAPGDSDWSVTKMDLQVSDMSFEVQATAGTIQLKDDKDKAKASIFFISYTIDHLTDSPSDRPVMFCFNGGPGSSSVWLHMGAFGPRRVQFDDIGHTLGPPYKLQHNPYSILQHTDLVFIDPVSTGFSRAEEGTNASEYHGVTKDINSIAEFIRLWLSKNDRWASPKYLAGESYGTTRAAGLANRLQSRGIELNGLVLVSAVLSFQTLRFDEGNDLPYQLYLPTYTALAHYHKQLDKDLQKRKLPELLDEVEEWSREVYGPALMRGVAIPQTLKKKIARQLAAYTALPEELILDSSLRIPQWRFSDNLLDESGQTIGRFDGRIKGPDLDRTSDRSGTTDPSYARVVGGFTGSFNDYVRTDLGYETDKDYGILVGVRWDYDRAKSNYLNVAGDLRKAMAENPKLRVYVAAGYYDLATPYHAIEHTLDHSITHPDARKRVTVGYYESGHMVFTHTPSLKALYGDLTRFLNDNQR